MPRWLVPLWVFLLPVQVEIKGFIIPRFAPSDLLVLAYMPYFLSKGWRVSRGVWHSSITGLAACFLLGNAVFFFTTHEISRWAIYNKTAGLIVVMLSYAMVSDYASAGWNRVHYLAKLFVRVVTLHAFLALAVLRLGLSERLHMNWGGGLRLSGFLVDPNAFGGLLAAAFVIALVIYFRKGALYQPVEGAIVAAVLAVGTFLTYSRSCWVGMIAGTLLGFAMGKVRYRMLSVAVVLLLGAVVYYSIPAVLSADATGGNPWEHSQVMASRQNPVDDRMDKMEEGITMFRESPVWGKGIGYFQWKRNSPAIIHNTLVWFLVEMGLIGLAVFAWFIIGHLRRAVFNVRRSVEAARPTSIGLLCGFVALTGLSAGIEALNQRHWWLIMALISAAWLLIKMEPPMNADRRGYGAESGGRGMEPQMNADGRR